MHTYIYTHTHYLGYTCAIYYIRYTIYYTCTIYYIIYICRERDIYREREINICVYIYIYIYIYGYTYIYIHIHTHLLGIVHPVSITRFPLRKFSPGAGLLRNPFVHR